MNAVVKCPACGKSAIDVRNYSSMMVLRPNYALFTTRCPACEASVSVMRDIPRELRHEVEFAALRVGAGMGKASR